MKWMFVLPKWTKFKTDTVQNLTYLRKRICKSKCQYSTMHTKGKYHVQILCNYIWTLYHVTPSSVSCHSRNVQFPLKTSPVYSQWTFNCCIIVKYAPTFSTADVVSSFSSSFFWKKGLDLILSHKTSMDTVLGCHDFVPDDVKIIKQ